MGWATMSGLRLEWFIGRREEVAFVWKAIVTGRLARTENTLLARHCAKLPP